MNPQQIEAFKYLLFAQQAYRDDWYAAFKKDVGLKNIREDLTDPRYLEAMVEFSNRFKVFLAETPGWEKRLDSTVPNETISRLVQEFDAYSTRLKETKVANAQKFTKAWITGLKKAANIPNEEALEKEVTTQILDLSETTENPEKLRALAEEKLTQRIPEQSREAARAALEPVWQSAERISPTLVAKPKTAEEITRAIIESPVQQKHLIIEIFEKAPHLPSQTALHLAAVAEATQAIPQGENLTTPTVFFQTGAKGLQKPLAVLADVALTVFPRGTREAIVERVIGRVTEKLGQAAVQSGVFRPTFRPEEPTRGLSGVRNFFADVTTYIFSAPRGPEDIMVLVELGIIKAEYVTGYQHVYVAGAHAKRPGLFGIAKIGGEAAARWGIEKAAGKAVSGILGKIGGFFAGSVVPVVGNILGTVLGDKVVRFLGGLAGGAINFLTGRRAGKEDPLALGGLGLVLLILGLAFLPLLLLGGFMGMNQQAMMNYGLTSTPSEQGSRFIGVSKAASQTSLPNGTSQSVTYTVTIEARERSLTNISVSDEFSVFSSSGQITSPAPSVSWPTTLGAGEIFTVSYEGPTLGGITDAVIANALVVTADAGDAAGEQTIAYSSVIIGSPPTECFVFGPAGTRDAYGHVSSQWDDQSGVLAAIALLAKSKSYMAQVCAGGTPITLYRVKANFGGGSVNSPNNIFLYNGGVSGINAVYTLAHETGHIVARRTNLFGQFHAEGIYSREGPIWTYPNAYSEGEDFAETFGVYVVYKTYTFSRRNRKLNYPLEYPLHFGFAKSVFGIEY